MKKRLLSITMLILIVLSILLPNFAESFDYENIINSLNAVECEEVEENDGVKTFAQIGEGEYARETAPMFNRVMGAVITIAQVLTFLIATTLLLYQFIKRFSLAHKIRKMEEENSEEPEDKEKLENIRSDYEIVRKRTSIFVFLIVLFYIFASLLNSVRDFAKPIIYIYPEEDGTNVEVKLENPEILTCSYPEYNDGWKVTADKDGTLTDKSGREYYALYWEGNNDFEESFKDGFVVKGEDTAEFLEEKLTILGLNARESEEFIVYWLPRLENNRYNLIRFKVAEELNEEVKLNISPEPDTLIRVMMEFKPLLIKRNIEEQVLTPITRNGYTVVEWGATEY